MANYEEAAKKFVQSRKRQPWDEPIGDAPKVEPKKAEPAKKESPKWMDSISSQVDAITKRNEDLDKRTRYLRKD